MALDKERLKEYKWIQENIKELNERVIEIDTRLQSCTSQLKADVVSTTKEHDKMTNLINDKMKLQAQIQREICKGYKEMEFIEEVIDKLPEREKLLMRYRYIRGFTMEEIAYRMNYSWRQVNRVHSDVLRKISKLA